MSTGKTFEAQLTRIRRALERPKTICWREAVACAAVLPLLAVLVAPRLHLNHCNPECYRYGTSTTFGRSLTGQVGHKFTSEP